MNRILEQVQSGEFDPKKVFTGNKDKFLEVKNAIQSITDNLSKEECINFILIKINPIIFDKSVSNVVRDEAVEIGLHILQFVNASSLSSEKQEALFKSIEESYTKVIGELRDNGYSNWDKLWIFLIKLCSEKLHTKLSLANKLLRIVEMAFRNSTSIEQRLKAYDCWIELINNSSLNMEHMCSPKQIKLLVTPMKAKFSRMPVVIMKRCDTFLYLLEKLGDKATLCLKEFLEFCFGPFDDKNDVEKMRQGRSVPEVCRKSTKVLLEIIGHSHDIEDNCLEDDLHLYKPMIQNSNFPNFAELLINSVTECCVLLNEWSQDAPSNKTVIKCLWRSIFQLVHNSSDDVKKRCFTHFNVCLKKLLERSKYNETLNVVLGTTVDLLIQDDVMVEKLKDITFDISMKIIQNSVDSCSFNMENVQKFVISCFNAENGSKFDKIASNLFKNNNKCENVIMCEVWLKCKISVVPESISSFIWPIRHVKNFKDVEALNKRWSKLYITESKMDSTKVLIMQEMEKLFLENPLLSSNIVQFLELMSSSENNASKEFVNKFMRLVELILTLPNLPDANVKKLSTIVLTYCDQNQHFYKSENNDEALDKLCGCLQHLIAIHKDYSILSALHTQLKDSQPKNLAKFSKRLISFLETLMLNDDNSVSNDTRKLMELLESKENESDTISLGCSRSLRLISMANASSKSIKSTNISRISSPSSLKSSRSISSPRNKNKTPKKDPIPAINEEKSSDFVKIDTEVKLNVNNLNEHQKEMLKKRREDIPALYQDLTQSQSQDLFRNTESNEVNEEKNTKDENKADSPPKKRKRSDMENEEHVSKIRKINDLAENNIEIRNSPDDDITQITGDLPESIQKAPPDDLSQMLEEAAREKTNENQNNSSGESPFTDNNDNKVCTKDDQTEINSEIVQNHVDETDIIESTEKSNGESVSPKSEKVKNVDKKIRKSKRHSSKQLREELVNAVKKQMELGANQNEDISVTPEISDSKSDDTLDDKQNSHEIEEHVSEDVNRAEDAKSTSEENVPVRKSKRQIKKRQSDYMFNFGAKKKSTDKESTKETDPVLPSSQEVLPNHVEKVDGESALQEKEDAGKNRKQRRQQQDNENNVDGANESMEELLAKVDKRIENSKKSINGNQNKVVWSPKKAGDDDPSAKKVKKRSSAPESTENTDEDVSLPDGDIVKTTDEVKPSTPEDVYEFKGDEEADPLEVVSKPKKKRRSLTFSRSDYISKRRKKPKKDKDEGFHFHVTADSAVPLSKSPSLRAVPSPQESETITIVITRSPPDSTKENTNANNSMDSPTSKRRYRRKQTLTAQSEDVIESSQVPPVETKRRSLSKSRSRPLKQTTIDETIKTFFQSPESNKRKTRNSSNQKESEVETETMSLELEETVRPLKLSQNRRLSLTEPSSQVNLAKRTQRSKSLDKVELTPEQLSFWSQKSTSKDAPVHVNDASADTLTMETDPQPDLAEAKLIQEADTLTLSPVKSQAKDDLPGSPVMCDTPDRTAEFLHDTSDISPISSQDVPAPIPKQTPTNEVTNMRVARLLQMVNSNVQVSNEGRRWFGNRHSSPRSSRVRKMRMKKEENLDILTFSREVPSPLTVPASGILKRKFNLDEAPTPSPKRKRVNFSDPATTEKKLFIKDAEEYEIDQNTDSTSEEAPILEDTDDFAEEKTKETPISFKEFCDGTSKHTSLNENEMKNSLKNILQQLKISEIVDIFSEYLNKVDAESLDEVKQILTDNGSFERISDQIVLPLIENIIDLNDFLPKLLKVVEKQQSGEKLEYLMNEVTKLSNQKRINVNKELTEEQIEDHVVNLDCDKMNNLIKKYFLNLEGQKRNDFLVDLMNLASSELPFNKEFVNCHVSILQNFVKKMTDS